MKRKEKIESCDLGNKILNPSVGWVVNLVIEEAVHEHIHIKVLNESKSGERLRQSGTGIRCHCILLPSWHIRNVGLALRWSWHRCKGSDRWSGQKLNRRTTYTDGDRGSNGLGRSLGGRANGHLSLSG